MLVPVSPKQLLQALGEPVAQENGDPDQENPDDRRQGAEDQLQMPLFVQVATQGQRYRDRPGPTVSGMVSG